MQHVIEDQQQLRTKKQIARYLNVSDASVERLMRRGLPYIKVGGLVRFRLADLADFLAANSRGGAEA